MKVKTIHVTAGRTISPNAFLHCTLRPQVSLTAEVGDDEDAIAAAKELHIQAESLLEDQVDELLAFAAARQSKRNWTTKHAVKAKAEREAAAAAT